MNDNLLGEQIAINPIGKTLYELTKTHIANLLSNKGEEVGYAKLIFSEGVEKGAAKHNLYGDALALSRYIYILSSKQSAKGFHSSNFSDSNYWISTTCFMNGCIKVTNHNIANFCREINSMRLINFQTGLASVCMLHIVNSCVREIAYVTQGTDMLQIQDWANNIKQGLVGNSQQYKDSERIARSIHQYLCNYNCGEDIQLYFVGHSLGGGLAQHNAIVTRRPAITFNPSTVNPRFRNMYKDNERYLIKNKSLLSFYIPGEILSLPLSDIAGLSKGGNRVKANIGDNASINPIYRHDIELDLFASQFGLKSYTVYPTEAVQKI